MSTTPPSPHQTQALSLFTLMFGAPPGNWLAGGVRVLDAGGSLADLARQWAATPEFAARFAGTGAASVDVLLSTIGIGKATAGYGIASGYLHQRLADGAPLADVVLELHGLLGSTQEPLLAQPRALFENMVAAASYHSLTLGLTGTVDAMRAQLAGVAADAASVGSVKARLLVQAQAAVQAEVLGLVALLFNAPPGDLLPELVKLRLETGSLAALADLLAGTPQFQSRFAGDTTPVQLVDTFLSFVGLVPGTPAHGAAAAAVGAQLQAGASVGTVAVQLLQFLQSTADPMFQPARLLLLHTVDVAGYHTLTLGLHGTAVDALRALIAGITSDPASVAKVKQALDKLAAPSDPAPIAPLALTSADSVADIATKLSAYYGSAATANASGMTPQQLEALGTHAAKLGANGITQLSLALGDALMTDAISAALLGKADGASVLATGATATEVASLATLAAHIAAGGITGTLPVTPAQLADLRGVLAPKLAAGLVLSVNGTAAADLIDLAALAHSATATGDAGDDMYVVDSLTHTITEAGGGGTDTVQSAVSITLPAHVEVISLTGSGNIDATGSAGADTLIGNSGDNLLTGADGNDALQGGAGKDTLHGGTGADTMAGGTGDDMYIVDVAGDSVTEAAGEGSDTVTASVTSYTLPSGVEVLSLVGSVNSLQGRGNELGNTIHGTAHNDLLYGLNGNDTLHGNDGDDILNGGTGNDSLYGGNGDDIAAMDLGSDYFDGGAGNDIVTMVGAYSDGVDTLLGGGSAGSDLVQILDAGVVNFSGATVTNFDAFSYSTAANVTRTLVLGSNVTNEQGHVTVEVAAPNPGNLVLDGSALGASTALYVGSVANWIGDDTMTGGAGADQLSGGAGSDSLVGNVGNDTLDGGAGIDTLGGGFGDDVYVVDVAGDSITEAASEGTDTVMAAVTYTLSANVEVLSLTGSAFITGTGTGGNNGLFGNSGNNTLTGLGGNDRLEGAGGDDSLYGGSGNDSLYGGSGNDHAAGGLGSDYVDGGDGDDVVTMVGSDMDGLDTLIGGSSAGIDVIQLSGAGSFNYGSATVTNFDTFYFMAGNIASRTVILGSNVTNDQGYVTVEVATSNSGSLTINGTSLSASTGLYIGSAAYWVGNDDIIGGAGNDSLSGADGNDNLDGRAGTDTLLGGSGHDTLRGGDGDDSLDGGDGTDNLYGDIGNDTLVGGDGNDSLIGGAGSDSLDGGSGADTFRYLSDAHGGDVIAGFASGTDKLAFQIPSLSQGVLAANRFANLSGDGVTSGLYSTDPSAFWASTAMNGKDTSGYFIFVLSDNRLYVDPDGAGATTAYDMAILTTGASTLVNTDILIT